jgi:phospholipid/cholesterol/gamma-HCH transport system substrate-binding protein
MPYTVDVTGRGEPTAVLARRGLIALVVLVALVVALLMQYKGAFRRTFPARLVVADIGDGITPGADVKLRGVVVGQVDSVGLGPVRDGVRMHQVGLSLDPAQAAGIPAGVTARVVPTNSFGAPSVLLTDPPGQPTRMLARNGVIGEDDTRKTLQLQTVLNQVYNILTSVKPAEINVALTNVSQALQGRGTETGTLIANGDRYITALNAQTPTFNALLRQIGPTVASVNDSAPALLDAVDNSVRLGRNLVDHRDDLDRVLTRTPKVADDADRFIGQIDSPTLDVLSDTHRVGDVLADQYRNIPESLYALGIATQLLGTAVNGGLHLSISLLPFAPYSSADCPRYGTQNGPNCTAHAPAPQAPPGFPFFQQQPGQTFPTPPDVLSGLPGAGSAAKAGGASGAGGAGGGPDPSASAGMLPDLFGMGGK